MKHLLHLLFAIAPIFAMSQATTLIISEFAEGSGNNKYIEIYNGTASAVDLSLYSLSSCSNGCNVFYEFDYPDNVTFAPGTMLASGATYIISHPSADPIILGNANQNFTFLSNGDDMFALTLAGATPSVYTIIDILGDMLGDPGTNWPVSGVSPGTQNHTMVRRPNVCNGNPVALSSFGIDSTSSEWWVFPINYWDSMAMHTQNCAPIGCNTFSTTTQASCGPYTAPSGAILTTTGIHLDTIANAATCDSIISINLTVNPLPTVTFGALPDTCENSPPIFLFQGSPASGTYSGTGVALGQFDPTAAGVGTHTLTYDYTDINGCSASATSDITVTSLPTVTFGVLADICIYNAAITLSQGSPAGGTYSGTGVTAGVFDPAIAGNGTHTISYFYSNGGGCDGVATSDIIVDGCSSVNEINVNNVSVYPNPTKGNIAISFEGANASVMVMDVKGQTLVTNSIVSNQSIDLSTLSTGTYFVKVTVDGTSFTQRIIVE